MSIENPSFSVREKWQASALQQSAHRVLRLWSPLAGGKYPFLLIIGLWFIVSVPPALFHGYHYVEGLTVTIAQSALDDGNWITPHLYNFRWVERPTLLSWVIAVICLPFGHVSPFVARLPVILSLLTGAFLVWRALRPVASPAAALFGAFSFLACPVVIRYYVTSVADLPLAVLLFGTFLIWWNAFVRERLSVGRWIGIGCLLAIAALMKGPQPVAYFMMGIFAFVVLTSTWWQIPGLVLAGVLAAAPTALWYAHVFVPGDQGEMLRYSRLSSQGVAWPRPLANAVEFFVASLPAALLAAALLLTPAFAVRRTVPRNYILALSCYALACTSVILFWPADVNPRYVLPMVPPLCVLAGIAYDALLERWPALVAGAISIVVGLLGYAVIHSATDVLFRPAYIRSKIDAGKITDLVHNAPAPVYRTNWTSGMNELPYTPFRVTTIRPEEMRTIPKPAWVVVPTEDAQAIIAQGDGRLTPRLELKRSILLRAE